MIEIKILNHFLVLLAPLQFSLFVRQQLMVVIDKTLKIIYFRFVDALLVPEVQKKYMHMPTAQQQRKIIISDVYNKYKLDNVIVGIDGCHFTFLEKPR